MLVEQNPEHKHSYQKIELPIQSNFFFKDEFFGFFFFAHTLEQASPPDPPPMTIKS